MSHTEPSSNRSAAYDFVQMNTLHLHGAEVRASFLTQRAHRAAYCDFLVRVTPENQGEALRAYRANETEFAGLRVEGAVDLSFLDRLPGLLYLEVAGGNGVDTSALARR